MSRERWPWQHGVEVDGRLPRLADDCLLVEWRRGQAKNDRTRMEARRYGLLAWLKGMEAEGLSGPGMLECSEGRAGATYASTRRDVQALVRLGLVEWCGFGMWLTDAGHDVLTAGSVET